MRGLDKACRHEATILKLTNQAQRPVHRLQDAIGRMLNGEELHSD
jgi:hypothetical protein